MQINKDNIRKNGKRADQDYKVGDEVMLDNYSAYKYKTPYKVPFLITRCWTDGMVTIQYGLIKIRHIIRRVKPYNYDRNVEYINPKNMRDGFNI